MVPRALLLLACLWLVACAKPVPVDYANYVGHWRGDGTLLVIRANGHADYERVTGQSRLSIEGACHSFTEDGFKIGVGLLSAHFEVSHPPRQVDGRWRMTVDGVELTRVDILPVVPTGEPGEVLRL
ncbi:MAG TPA: hypothetical protein VFQ84_08280 [Arenimonas sp.]|uniref:hypothetical protein n=1 Tax=Arenimonas sp. TaxID=1872635 RepID=UPI002D7F2A1E|nr:hypothetical protein [Arenimonas sp.]HEU0153326.1 hypothetical protein [Arenimonas sp.]